MTAQRLDSPRGAGTLDVASTWPRPRSAGGDQGTALELRRGWLVQVLWHLAPPSGTGLRSRW